jgi:hypothetical protein
MLLAFSLLAAAGPVAAQSPAPQPPAPQPQPSATPAPQPAERKPLILNLDEASRRQIMRGQPAEERTDGGAARGLPSLGEGARPLETLRSSPYPKSSDNLP